jgi:outer membrane receptor for ferrienterochelin and colicins
LNDNFQLGIDIKPPKDKAKTSLMSYSTSLNTTFFHKQNAIDIVNVNPAANEFQYLNLGDYYGLIFNLDNRVKYKDYILVFGTSLNGFSRRFNGVQVQQDKYMFNWTMNANFTFNLKKYDVKLTAVNKFHSLNNFVVYNLASNKVEQSQFPAYMYTDINASKTILNKKLNVTIGVKNIFNIQNLRVLGYSGNVHNFSNSNEVNNLWGRTLFTSLTLNLDDI